MDFSALQCSTVLYCEGTIYKIFHLFGDCMGKCKVFFLEPYDTVCNVDAV